MSRTNPPTLVVIMGPTGVGKSNFIDKLVGGKARAGNKLQSCTSEISEVTYRAGGKEIRLVDTPGFDDTTKEDYDILKLVAKWLKKTYDSSTKVSAIIYLHRITDNRVGGSSMRNLRMFGKLTGDAAANKVFMVTTMWDQPKLDMRAAEGRELELRDRFWAPLIRHGARMGRFTNTADSGATVLKAALEPHPSPYNSEAPLLLQEELSDLKKLLEETSAGKALYSDLQRLLDDQKRTMEDIAKQAGTLGDPRAKKILEAELVKIEQELQGTFTSIKQLKPGFFRSLMSALFGKKSKGRSVEFGN